jgi:hypothetical protein
MPSAAVETTALPMTPLMVGAGKPTRKLSLIGNEKPQAGQPDLGF